MGMAGDFAAAELLEDSLFEDPDAEHRAVQIFELLDFKGEG
jgi:hypothetical protein